MDRLNNNCVYILIGGRGFLGSALTRFLHDKGEAVYLVNRGDLTDAGSITTLASALKAQYSAYHIIDMAYTSVPNTSYSDPVRDYSENLSNILRHIDFVKQLPGAEYTYVSSGGTVYGNVSDKIPVKEEGPHRPVSPYGITKLACEHYVMMHRETDGIDARIVRPSNIYGPGQLPFRGQGIIATVMALVLAGKPVQLYGDGSVVRDYLFISDLCSAVYDVVTLGANGGIYNIGSGTGYSIAQLVDAIGFLPGMSEMVIDRLPPRPFDVRYNVLDPAALQELNGWKPKIALHEGLLKSLEWLKTR